MVLSNKKLKQKLRSEQPTAAPNPTPARLGPSEREKRRHRNQSLASVPPPDPAEIPAKNSPVDASSPRLHGREDDAGVDDAEMESYSECMRKVLEKHSGGEEPAQQQVEGSTVVFDPSDSKSLKRKKRRKVGNGQLVGELHNAENKQTVKSKKRVSPEMADAKLDYREPTDGSKEHIDNSGKLSKEFQPVTVIKEAGEKSSVVKNTSEDAQKQEPEKLQEQLPKAGDKNVQTDRNAQPFHSPEDEALTDSKAVYVGGIPYYCSEDDIRVFFGDCGSISEVTLKTFPDSGKFRGIALLTFKTEAAAQRALALDGSDMGGRFLKVQACASKPQESVKKEVYKEPPRKTQGYTRAYIGNLSWDITEDEIREVFKDCKIDAIRFALDKMTGEFRGYGHIDFADDESLERALQLDQQPVLGRPIKIAYAVTKKDGKAVPERDGNKEQTKHGKTRRQSIAN